MKAGQFGTWASQANLICLRKNTKSVESHKNFKHIREKKHENIYVVGMEQLHIFFPVLYDTSHFKEPLQIENLSKGHR